MDCSTEHTEDVWSDSVELSVFPLCRSYGTHFYQYFVPNETLLCFHSGTDRPGAIDAPVD